MFQLTTIYFSLSYTYRHKLRYACAVFALFNIHIQNRRRLWNRNGLSRRIIIIPEVFIVWDFVFWLIPFEYLYYTNINAIKALRVTQSRRLPCGFLWVQERPRSEFHGAIQEGKRLTLTWRNEKFSLLHKATVLEKKLSERIFLFTNGNPKGMGMIHSCTRNMVGPSHKGQDLARLRNVYLQTTCYRNRGRLERRSGRSRLWERMENN